MRISTKGQITVPQRLRDQFGLLPYTDVIFEINQAGEIVLRKNSTDWSRGKSLVQLMRNRSDVKMTTADIMKLTRAHDSCR